MLSYSYGLEPAKSVMGILPTGHAVQLVSSVPTNGSISNCEIVVIVLKA